MPAEVRDARFADAHSDIHQVGAIAYKMLFDELPEWDAATYELLFPRNRRVSEDCKDFLKCLLAYNVMVRADAVNCM